MTQHEPQNTLFDKISWQWATVISIALVFGPLCITITALSMAGANVLNGIYSVYINTPLERWIVKWGTLFTMAGPIIAFIFAIIFAVKQNNIKTPQRLAPLIAPIAIVFGLIVFIVLAGSIGLMF